MTLSLAIAGAAGRMGRALINAALDKPVFSIAGGTERAGSPSLGKDLGVIVGRDALGASAVESANAAAANAEAWIDFTAPEATLAALAALNPAQTRAVIIGTTGLSEADEAKIADAAQRFAIVKSGNFSLGVTLLSALTRIAAAKLGPDWDIEIVEAHHRRKVDAPSGTALLLGQAAASGRNVKLNDKRLAARDGHTGARPEGGIGFAVIRGGGVIGEHDVVFASEREILTLSHSARDRAIFADGALAAARWAAGKPPGLYSMDDVLDL
jgi:4-hydroxy-tetrahydrodipicolinate reductase